MDRKLKKLVSTKPFKVKSNDSDGVIIEGFANKHIVDRGNDIIATDAWQLDNFKKNPVILFNHGMDKLGGIPVGKALDITPTDDGLFIKAQLSNSDHPDVSLVRDLVQEGILKSFSVGFDPVEMEETEIDGKSVNKITKAELFENSIVGIPMNQDSTFNLAEKMLQTKDLYEIKKSFLADRKAWVAGAIHVRMHEMSESKKSLMDAIAEKAGIDVEALKEVLSGDEAASADVLLAACDVLSMDLERFKALEEESSEKSEDSDEDEDKEDKQDEVVEEKAEDSDEDEDKEDDEESKKSVHELLENLIPGLIADGTSKDQAVASAFGLLSEEISLSEEEKLALYAQCFNALDIYETTGEFSLGSTQKQAVAEGETGDTVALQTEKTELDLSSPMLDGQKQTNVLLGTLVSEIQSLGDKIEQLFLGSTSKDEAEVKENDEVDESTNEEILDDSRKQLENLKIKLKAIGH